MNNNLKKYIWNWGTIDGNAVCTHNGEGNVVFRPDFTKIRKMDVETMIHIHNANVEDIYFKNSARFGNGDEVWYLHNNKVSKDTIQKVNVSYQTKNCVVSQPSENMFESKEELLKSL